MRAPPGQPGRRGVRLAGSGAPAIRLFAAAGGADAERARLSEPRSAQMSGHRLAAAGSPAARAVLVAAALGGLVTAMPLWVPAGIVIGAAAVVLGRGDAQEAA